MCLLELEDITDCCLNTKKPKYLPKLENQIKNCKTHTQRQIFYWCIFLNSMILQIAALPQQQQKKTHITKHNFFKEKTLKISYQNWKNISKIIYTHAHIEKDLLVG